MPTSDLLSTKDRQQAGPPDRPAKTFRLTCVPNGAGVWRHGELYFARSESAFILELAKLAGHLHLLQGPMPAPDETLRYAVCMTREGNLTASGGKATWSPWQRAKAYVEAVFRCLSQAWTSDFSYLYFPGSVSNLYGLMCMVLRRRYGVYLRGEADWDAWLTRRILRNAEFVLATGEGLRQKAARLCRNAVLVRPMIDVHDALRRPARSYRSPSCWNILCVATIRRRKGIAELLDATRALRARRREVRFHLLGKINEPALGPEGLPPDLADVVQYHAPVADPDSLNEFYRQADLFVLPSHTEGFPRVLYEAMAHGLPIVTTFVGSIPSLMVDRVNCRRVEVGDAGGLAGTIEELMADEPQRRRLGEKARETVREYLGQFDKSHAEQVIDLVAQCGNHGR